jgi:hypothetical protein
MLQNPHPRTEGRGTAPNRYLITSLPHYVRSFVAQRDHGVDQGRAAGWDVAGRQSDENQ